MGLTKQEIETIETKGFKVTNVKDFLDLTAEDELIIELRLALASLLYERRKMLALSQTDIARRIGSSQSRMARIENNDPSVSTDLLLKAVAATGATINDLAEMIRPTH
jgi:DNA-binding XRE family transcriptional regulator